MIQAVIFDMDGVLIDSEIVYTEHVYKKLSGKYTNLKIEQLYPVVGSSRQRTRELIFQAVGEPFDSPEFNKTYETLYKDIPVDYPSILRDGVHEILTKLKENGYKLALASSTYMAGIEKVLSSCKLENYFDSIISGGMFKETKPNPEIYLYTAKQLDVQLENCLVIEDSTYGVTSAHRAGMAVAALRDERFNFDQSLADYSIGSLWEIFAVLDKLNES